MARTIVGCARSVIRLHEEIRKTELKLTKLKNDLESAKENLLGIFQRNSIQAHSTKTHTLSLSRQIWASLRDKEVAISVLKKHGLDWMVKEGVSTQTLSAWVREQCEDETQMPKLGKELKRHIRVFEKFDIRVRRK